MYQELPKHSNMRCHLNYHFQLSARLPASSLLTSAQRTDHNLSTQAILMVVSNNQFQEWASLCLDQKLVSLSPFFCFCERTRTTLLFGLRENILMRKNITKFKLCNKLFLVYRVFGILFNSFKSLQLWPKIDVYYSNFKGLFYNESGLNCRRDSEYNPSLCPCCI